MFTTGEAGQEVEAMKRSQEFLVQLFRGEPVGSAADVAVFRSEERARAALRTDWARIWCASWRLYDVTDPASPVLLDTGKV